MKKNVLASLVAAVSFVSGGFVFSSCSEQQAIAPESKAITEYVTKYVDVPVDHIIGNTLVAQTLEDHIEFLYNGELALTARVTPDSLVLTLPVEEHTASTIDGDNNRWKDSHGMGFTGIINLYQLQGLSLDAHIEPADPFSTTKSIHPKVTWLKGRFNLVGMATDNQTGKSTTFSIPVPTGDYFMCDGTAEVFSSHVYEVDTVRSVVKDSEGHVTGGKMRVTVTKDGETFYKGQYMWWETGLATGTITGTQVGNNQKLRATSYGTPEEYKVEGWWGEENLKGATTTAYSLQYKFRTAFKAVPGFEQSEESVAETNLVFGKRDFYLKDAETGWELSIPAGDLKVVITFDQVGNDEAAKAEVNGRGLEYEYIGTHYLSFDQYVGGVKVNSQSRAENLLFPKN